MGPGDSHDDAPFDDHDEGTDDEGAAPRGAPPDPMDRLWLHPTELPIGPPPAASAPAPARGARRRVGAVLIPVLAGVAGALVAVLVLALTGALDRGPESTPSSGAAVPPATGLASTASDAAARLGASIVAVAARDSKGSREGSGVSVRHGGEVVTAAHVVGDAKTVDVITPDGQRHRATVKGRDPVTDLALLTLDADVPAAQLSDTAPTAGDSVWVVGAAAPGTKSTWLSDGTLVTTDALVVNSPGPSVGGLLETDAASSDITNGGALVDDQGQVTGIVLGRLDEGTTYAVPIATVVGVAEQLHSNGQAEHGWLGVTGTDKPAGAAVATVVKESPAARAGVRAGDIVDRFDGRAVESTDDLMAMVRSVDPGQSVVMELSRGQSMVKVRVTLAAHG
jgi:putative serine protease PepD